MNPNSHVHKGCGAALQGCLFRSAKALRYRRFASTAGFVLFAVARVTAQSSESLRLTLDDAQTRARETSHRLAEIDAMEAGALAAVQAREAASRPNVTAQAAYTRTNHIEEFVVPSLTGGAPRVLYPDIPDNYRTRLDLQWPIFSSGRSDALVRAARSEASALASDRDAARADLRLEVARAYWALVTARAAVGVLEQALERAQAHVRDAGERLKAGLTPPNELASAEAMAARQRVLLIETRNQRDIASSQMARLVGVSLDRPIEPLELLAGGARGAGRASEAGGMRPEHVALEFRLAAAEERYEAALRGRRPSLAVAAGLDYARPNQRIFPLTSRWEDSWDAGVRLTWPLWDGGRVSADVAEALAAATAVRRRLEDFDAYTALEARQRTLELESSRAAVEAADEGVRSATEARRVTAERYAVGVATNTEVLDAQNALLQAELDRTRTLAGVRLAEARLVRAAGQ